MTAIKIYVWYKLGNSQLQLSIPVQSEVEVEVEEML